MIKDTNFDKSLEIFAGAFEEECTMPVRTALSEVKSARLVYWPTLGVPPNENLSVLRF